MAPHSDGPRLTVRACHGELDSLHGLGRQDGMDGTKARRRQNTEQMREPRIKMPYLDPSY